MAVTLTVQWAAELLVHRLRTNLATRVELSTSLVRIAMMKSKASPFPNVSSSLVQSSTALHPPSIARRPPVHLGLSPEILHPLLRTLGSLQLCTDRSLRSSLLAGSARPSVHHPH